MSLKRFFGVGIMSLGFVALAAGCSDDDGGTTPDGGGGAEAGIEAGAPDGSTDAPPATKAQLRIAHLAPDAPAVKVCARAAGSTGAFAELTAGISGGLSYKQVSSYIEVDAGTYTAKIVAASGDCDAQAVFEGDLPALTAGAQATVAASGQLTASPSTFAVSVLIDEATASDKAKLRFVHASQGTPIVDVGVYNADKTFNKLFENQLYIAETGAQTKYVALDSAIPDSLDVDVRVPGLLARYATLRLPAGVSVALGSNATVFAHGILTTSPLGGVEALACIDSAPGANGLATCVDMIASPAAPALTKVRAGHFAKGAPEVIACARPKGFTGDYTPVYATTTLTYGDFGYSVDVPADTYEVKIVAATGDCKDAAAASIDSPALASEGAYSIIAGGDIAATPASLALFAFVDDATAPASGSSRGRFVHLGVDAPAVDVGAVSGTNITKVWNNAAFGAPAAPQVNGEYKDFPVLSSASVGYTAAGTAAVLHKTAAAVSTTAGTIYTIIAADKLDGAATPAEFLEAFVCDDSANAGGDGKVDCIGPVDLN
jgi:hypothetical protein